MTEDIAMRNLSWGLAPKQTEEERRVQAGIDATIRAVAADRYNPVWQPASPRVTVQSGVKVDPGLPLDRGTGWREEAPLGIPPGQEAIERLVNAMLPHGRDSRAGKGANES